jgi:DNA-binding response OmpR family regulator
MARIIIVDDDELIAEIVTDALRDAGHMVSSVHHGGEAVAAIVESEPDLVILDYTLPGKTGMQILREIRAMPGSVDMPVMMLTARGGRLHIGRADAAGADDYIVKPFDPSDLGARVESLLKGALISRAVSRVAQDPQDDLP